MKTLITPLEVLRLAFTAGESLPPESIAEEDIAAAEARWIVPVVGRTLHERLLGGASPAFTAEYLAAPTALFTRALLQPRLDIRTDRCGTTAPRPADGQPAGGEALRDRKRELLREARTLLGRATRHLAEHPDEFPEYDPREDVSLRCSLAGGIILSDHGPGTR